MPDVAQLVTYVEVEGTGGAVRLQESISTVKIPCRCSPLSKSASAEALISDQVQSVQKYKVVLPVDTTVAATNELLVTYRNGTVRRLEVLGVPTPGSYSSDVVAICEEKQVGS
jgi:hypothetical protein